MPKFSERSESILSTVNPDIQMVMRRVIKFMDITVLNDGGLRTKERQRELVESGKSKTMNSKHLTGDAIDVAPWPLDWNDKESFVHMAGVVIGVAETLGVPLRWGGDWNRDFRTSDTSFFDGPHFEIAE